MLFKVHFAQKFTVLRKLFHWISFKRCTACCRLPIAPLSQLAPPSFAHKTKLLPLKHTHTHTHTHIPNAHRPPESISSAPRFSSLGGPQPYVPVAGYEEDDELAGRLNSVDLSGNSGYKRARVLCSYDAKDGTELNLTSNEVIFVCECNPPNSDYMNGKQGLLKGLVPKAFLELLDD